MNDFLESIIKRDPAARSKLSLILTYPGVKAVLVIDAFVKIVIANHHQKTAVVTSS